MFITYLGILALWMRLASENESRQASGDKEGLLFSERRGGRVLNVKRVDLERR